MTATASSADDIANADPLVAASYSVRDLSVQFNTATGPLDVLDDVTFDVPAGEIVGIIGRSGTGKTTLLRVLGGLQQSTAGVVEFSGRPLSGPSPSAVTVFQDYGNALLPWRTVERNIGLGLERTHSRAERERRVEEVLHLVGLEGRGGDLPWKLSGGMQQRVQIARALAVRPSVLLLDEPFGALDAMTKSSLQDELLRVQAETGATVIFITHDIDEAAYLSDRVLVIAGSPGTVTVQVETQLPRPRDQVTTRESPEYLRIRHRLSDALRPRDRRDGDGLN